jgi:hypothetical protein
MTIAIAAIAFVSMIAVAGSPTSRRWLLAWYLIEVRRTNVPRTRDDRINTYPLA